MLTSIPILSAQAKVVSHATRVFTFRAIGYNIYINIAFLHDYRCDSSGKFGCILQKDALFTVYKNRDFCVAMYPLQQHSLAILEK